MKNQKILLLLLPFWTPLIPPMGQACLKGFLQDHGFSVKTVDANVEPIFRQGYDDYFATLKEGIPTEKAGNFYNIGIDVLQNHMTAFFRLREPGNDTDATTPGTVGPDERADEQYVSFIEALVAQNFFCTLDLDRIRMLDDIVARFYKDLETYIQDLLAAQRPDVLGISIYKGTFGPSLFAFKKARETHPQVKTVMGGGIFSDQLALGSPNFEYFRETTPYIDHIVVGEGELLFLKLLQGELPADQKVFTREDLQGEMLDLTAAPLPDFSDVQIHHYPELTAYTSRSCPFQCGFCAETVNWGHYRRKSADRVAAELLDLNEKYGPQLFLMSDSLLNPIVDDLSARLLEGPKAIYWDGYLRAEKQACDPHKVFQWRRGGFYRARLGLESGSPRILELMDKRITTDQIKTVLTNLAQAGIKTSTYWVIGYPGETEADFLATLDIIAELREVIYEAECNPFRFYLSGQVNSDHWGKNHRIMPLYAEEYRELSVLQTYMLQDGQPSREEIYRRLNRFSTHCREVGVPNPYSWSEIHDADRRWRQLHPNAVPALVDFQDDGVYIDECRRVEKLLSVAPVVDDGGDFEF